ncbi:hypothetical protein [Micromonospora sp. NPDC048898]|uniref:hypothetical protein n=1 Tax=Micromonospora sp. NPDC048898 TaxID=3364260 RepID=UPI003719A510
MLTPTRIRLVNVGIERPRFPDLIIDMRAGTDTEDVVIMLQNGGGKTTFISMWMHLYEPHRNKFLAKMSQRAQKKSGPAKEFDDYIPVGQTTYVVCEHAIPGAAPNLFGQVPRLVAGYAAWRDNEAQERADERFFCFVSNDKLTFDTLPLRSATGEPVDHDAFFDHLIAAKHQDPSLQLADETRDNHWRDELRSRNFDLDFLRQFLLRMNVDEGATDRLFTYSSSRTFINSLIDILADDADTTVITTELGRLRGKVAARTVNLATDQFLQQAIKHTGQLADSTATYTTELTARTAALTQWAQASHVVEQWTALTSTALTRVDAIVDDARERRDGAAQRHRHLRQQHAASMMRRREMELDQVRADLDTARQLVGDAEHHQQVARASTLIASSATASQIKQHAAEQLDRKVREAAPLRDRLACAAHALTARYTADAEGLAGQRTQINAEDTAAREELQRIAAAQPVLAGQHADARRDLEDVAQRRKDGELLRRELRESGTVLPTETGEQAKGRHQRVAQDAHDERGKALATAAAATAAGKSAAADARAVQPRITTVGEQIVTAEQRLRTWNQTSDELGAALLASGLIDLDPVSLDEHADVLDSALREHRESLRSQIRDRSIVAGQIERDVDALNRTQLLPPRHDVEALAERVRTATTRAVLPGWQCLADLPPHVAEDFALRHPEVADGLVVTIDDDYRQVADWLAVHAGEFNLSAPVVLTTAAAFQLSTGTGAGQPQRAVLLPDPAHWDKNAGREAATTANSRHEQALHERDAAQDRAGTVEQLLHDLDRWRTRIGAGARDRLAAEITALHEDKAAFIEQQSEHERAAADANSLAEESREQAEGYRGTERTALDEARSVQALVVFESEAPELDQRQADAQSRRDNAERQIQQDKDRGQDLERTREDCGRRRFALSVKEHDLQSRQTVVSAVVRTHPAPPGTSTAAFGTTSTDALHEQVFALQAEYDGLVTDEELRLTMRDADKTIEQITKKLKDLDAQAVHDAAQRHTDDPQRSQAAWDQDLADAGDDVDKAKERRAELTERERGALRDLATARDIDGANATLLVQWNSGSLDTLIQLQQQLEKSISDAAGQRADAATTLDASIAAQTRLTVFTSTVKDRFASRLETAATTLAAPGKLGRHIDLTDLRFREHPGGGDTDPATARLTLIREALDEAADSGNLDAFTPALDRLNPEDLQPLVDRTIGNLENVDRRYRHAEDRTHAHAEALRQCSSRASKDAAAKIVDRLKSETVDELISNAASNHHNASQRLAAVQSELKNFEKELDASARAVKNIIETIRGRIVSTTKQSRLPNEPKLGRWAGQDFLRITWSEVGREARTDQLREAFQRMITTGADDDQSPMHRLVEAITANLSVSILIPKVPFDGTHYPIEQLARRTSGGEGVTAGILIAALMQSMRTNNPTFLVIDNIFAKVSEPGLLRLIQHVARGLNVQLILMTPSRDEHALSAFSHWIQLKVETTASNHTIVAPAAIPTATIPQQLRRQPLTASPAVSSLGMSSAVVSITDASLGTTIPITNNASDEPADAPVLADPA